MTFPVLFPLVSARHDPDDKHDRSAYGSRWSQQGTGYSRSAPPPSSSPRDDRGQELNFHKAPGVPGGKPRAVKNRYKCAAKRTAASVFRSGRSKSLPAPTSAGQKCKEPRPVGALRTFWKDGPTHSLSRSPKGHQKCSCSGGSF